MVFIDSSMGLALIDGLIGITGSLFLSMLMLVAIFMVLALALRLPLEFTAIFILPILLVTASFTGNIIPVLGVGLIYLGFLLGKNIIS